MEIGWVASKGHSPWSAIRSKQRAPGWGGPLSPAVQASMSKHRERRRCSECIHPRDGRALRRPTQRLAHSVTPAGGGGRWKGLTVGGGTPGRHPVAGCHLSGPAQRPLISQALTPGSQKQRENDHTGSSQLVCGHLSGRNRKVRRIRNTTETVVKHLRLSKILIYCIDDVL